jgi:hypothetical protein
LRLCAALVKVQRLEWGCKKTLQKYEDALRDSSQTIRYGRVLASILALFSTFHFLPTQAYDYRKLPKAGFPPNPNSQSNSDLPTSFGVHLSPGQDRRANAPVNRYDPGEPTLNMQLVRWDTKKMPLLIWISPGLKLPDCPFDQIPATRVDLVTQMLQAPGNPFADLETVKGWVPDVNDQVAAGIEQWREFEGEGLLSFAFTDDPRMAHIMIFFTDAFRDATAPGGIMVGGITSAQLYPVAQAQQMKIKQKPVIIELSTLVNHSDQKMQSATAHEFGHALGIKAHSPYREDIMFADRIVDHLSPADKATIRYLYHSKPQWVM